MKALRLPGRLRLLCAMWLAWTPAVCVLAASLPSPAQLRAEVRPYLAVPLPTIESLVGIRMPASSPMLVVASFGDSGLPAESDRGYAVGRILNDLLFGAHENLDVEAPGYYPLDVLDKGVPSGRARDSRANAYRVAGREAAQWCVYGNVEGIDKAYRVITTIDDCKGGREAKQKIVTVHSDADWPRALRELCDYVIAVAAKPSPRALTACGRAAAIRPASFMAFTTYAATRGMPREQVEKIVAADPTFSPAVTEVIYRLPMGTDKGAYLEKVQALAAAEGGTPAVAMAAYAQQLAANAWKIEHRPYPKLMELIRANPQLRAPWLLLAQSLSNAAYWDYPNEPAAVTWLKKQVSWEGANYFPNEVTHSAALAVSLAYYDNWPDSYRAHWQVGFAVARYALMLRGNEYWVKVPKLGKRAFNPLMKIANVFNASALSTQKASSGLWAHRITTARHSGEDWLAIFDDAAERHPRAQWIYDTAMCFAQNKWGGSQDDRQHVQDLAIRNNPDAEWAKTLDRRFVDGIPSKET